MYTTTTNNIFKPSGWGYVPVELFYGICVDDKWMTQVNSLPDGKYISYAADGDNRWKDGILNNIHVSTSEEHMSENRGKQRKFQSDSSHRQWEGCNTIPDRASG